MAFVHHSYPHHHLPALTSPVPCPPPPPAESHYLPPANIRGCTMKDTIIAAGSEVVDSTLNNCVVGLRSHINAGCKLDRVFMMGADYYETSQQARRVRETSGIPIGVGSNCVLKNVIIDKNARIGKNCTIINKAGVQEANREAEGLYIRSGIVTVLKNATVPDNTVV